MAERIRMDTEDSPVSEMNDEDTLALLTSVMKAAKKNVSVVPEAGPTRKSMTVVGVIVTKRRGQHQKFEQEPDDGIQGMDVAIETREEMRSDEQEWVDKQHDNSGLSNKSANVEARSSDPKASDGLTIENNRRLGDSPFQNGEEMALKVVAVVAAEIETPTTANGIEKHAYDSELSSESGSLSAGDRVCSGFISDELCIQGKELPEGPTCSMNGKALVEGSDKLYAGRKTLSSCSAHSDGVTTHTPSVKSNEIFDYPTRCPIIEKTKISIVRASCYPEEFEKCTMVANVRPSKQKEEQSPGVAETDNSESNDDSCDEEGSGHELDSYSETPSDSNSTCADDTCTDRSSTDEGNPFTEDPSYQATNDRDGKEMATYSTGFSIRQQIKDLVRALCPEEATNLEAMFVQFNGREEELLNTLHLMKERRARVRARAACHKSRARPVPRLHEVPGLCQSSFFHSESQGT